MDKVPDRQTKRQIDRLSEIEEEGGRAIKKCGGS